MSSTSSRCMRKMTVRRYPTLLVSKNKLNNGENAHNGLADRHTITRGNASKISMDRTKPMLPMYPSYSVSSGFLFLKGFPGMRDFTLRLRCFTESREVPAKSTIPEILVLFWKTSTIARVRPGYPWPLSFADPDTLCESPARPTTNPSCSAMGPSNITRCASTPLRRLSNSRCCIRGPGLKGMR